MEKSAAIALPASFQTSEGQVGGKLNAAEVTITERTATPNSCRTSEVSTKGGAEPAVATVAEGASAPKSFQTSEGISVEKALALDNVPYLRGWRLHFLSLRSAPSDHNFCFAKDLSAWPFCSSLSTSRSQSSGRP